jgi:PGF-CTERM protein
MIYFVKADDSDGHTDEATVEIVTVVPTPTATPTPTPGFEPVFAITGLLAIAYLVVFV